MYELTCPACNSTGQYDLKDYILMCPYCSKSFILNLENGQKDIFSDHYIIPNTADALTVKNIALEWLKRIHHKPQLVDKEFTITKVIGASIPFWVTSVEVHTIWKGLVKKENKFTFNPIPGSEYIIEKGHFRRSLRWAISARNNLCEYWGINRLHQPPEKIQVEWDGFPLDSTFSRGLLNDVGEKELYKSREFFDYKYSNGLIILGVQVNEEEALRRTKNHLELYHYKISQQQVDYLVDYRSELEIIGIQLIHLPFWFINYVYTPKNTLKYFYKPTPKNIIIEGHALGVLKGELALVYQDKMWINSIVCFFASLLFLILGLTWHPAFLIVTLFGLAVGSISAYLSIIKKFNFINNDNNTQIILPQDKKIT